jgi:hypothetical protein
VAGTVQSASKRGQHISGGKVIGKRADTKVFEHMPMSAKAGRGNKNEKTADADMVGYAGGAYNTRSGQKT